MLNISDIDLPTVPELKITNPKISEENDKINKLFSDIAKLDH